jgi:hypothetical protein
VEEQSVSQPDGLMTFQRTHPVVPMQVMVAGGGGDKRRSTTTMYATSRAVFALEAHCLCTKLVGFFSEESVSQSVFYCKSIVSYVQVFVNVHVSYQSAIDLFHALR